jgi:hypothetical protein
MAGGKKCPPLVCAYISKRYILRGGLQRLCWGSALSAIWPAKQATQYIGEVLSGWAPREALRSGYPLVSHVKP